MRVPRITVRADFDDVNTGELSTASIGYGLHQAWIYATMFGTAGLFGVSTIPNGTDFSSVYLISLATNCLVLLLVGMLDSWLARRASIKRYPLVAPALLMSLGTFLVLFSDASGPYAVPIAIAAGLFTGGGSALFLLYWGFAFACMNLISVIMNTVIAFLMAVVVYVVLLLLPVPFGGVAAALLPWIEMALLYRQRPRPYFGNRDLVVFNPLPVNHGRFYLALALPMLFFGFALGYIRECSMSVIVSSFGLSGQVVPLVVSGTLSAVVLAGGLGAMRSDQIEEFLRPVMPLTAFAIAFIMLGLGPDDPAPDVIVLAGYICFEGVIWVIFGFFSQQYRLSPMLVYGIGRGALGAGSIAGLAIGALLGSSEGSLLALDTGFVVIALVCIIAGQALLPNERDIRRIVLHGDIDVDSVADMLNLRPGEPLTRARHHEQVEQEALEEECGRSPDVLAADDGAALSGDGILATGDSDENSPVEAVFGSGAQDESAEVGSAPYRDGGVSDGTPEGPRFSVGEDVAVVDSPVADAGHRDDGAAEVQDKGSRYHNTRLMPAVIEAIESEESEDRKVGYFRRKCEVIANQYLLSARETEVLFYLAKGFNSAYLQKKLYISEGTAKTHIRHIYGKTNVHSQQELMRLVNEVWLQ